MEEKIMTRNEMEYIREHLNEIVEKAKRGDEKSFEQLMNLVEERAKNFATYSFNEYLADDVVQEARIAAYKNLRSLKKNDSFESWFFRILNLKIKDMIRKKKRNMEKGTSLDRLKDELGDSCSKKFIEDSSSWEPEINVHKKEVREGLCKLISDLPDYQYLAIVSFYFENKTVKEIANEKNVSVNTVKGWLRRARKKILYEIEGLRANNASFFFAQLLMAHVRSEQHEAIFVLLKRYSKF